MSSKKSFRKRNKASKGIGIDLSSMLNELNKIPVRARSVKKIIRSKKHKSTILKRKIDMLAKLEKDEEEKLKKIDEMYKEYNDYIKLVFANDKYQKYRKYSVDMTTFVNIMREVLMTEELEKAFNQLDDDELEQFMNKMKVQIIKKKKTL